MDAKKNKAFNHFKNGRVILFCSIALALFLHIIMFLFSFPHTNRVTQKGSDKMFISLITNDYHQAKKNNDNLQKTKTLEKITKKTEKKNNNPISNIEKETDNNGGTDSLVTIKNPKFVFFKPPKYPKRAIENRQQGIVALSITVASNGKPVKIDILNSSGYELLDKAATEAAHSWIFEPIAPKESNVAFKAHVNYNFILK